MNHPSASDALRREAESKLIRHKQQYLHALPASSTKTALLNDLEELVNGVVLLGIPDELAWTICLEGKNHDTIGKSNLGFYLKTKLNFGNLEGFGFTFLRQMINLFPDRPLMSLLKAYFAYVGIPLSSDEERLPEPNRDAYDLILVSAAACRPVIMFHPFPFRKSSLLRLSSFSQI
jgi:superkiller protein 3